MTAVCDAPTYPMPTAPRQHIAPAVAPAARSAQDDGNEDSFEPAPEVSSDPLVWRARLMHKAPSLVRAAHMPCWRSLSEEDAVCWESASPDVYYARANVSLDALDMPDANGDTWVHRAAACKNASVVVDLLERVDNRLVDRPNHQGQTPLHCAVKRDAFAVVVALLMHGADPARKDDAGNTALALACVQGAGNNLVALLLEHPDTDVNAINAAGHTPLMSSIAEHHNHLLESLMPEPDLDWQCRTPAGQNVTQVALAAHNIVALARIVAYLSDPSPAASDDDNDASDDGGSDA